MAGERVDGQRIDHHATRSESRLSKGQEEPTSHWMTSEQRMEAWPMGRQNVLSLCLLVVPQSDSFYLFSMKMFEQCGRIIFIYLGIL
jgi:hypothetical protein